MNNFFIEHLWTSASVIRQPSIMLLQKTNYTCKLSLNHL